MLFSGCDNIVLEYIGYCATTVFGVFSCLPRQKQNNWVLPSPVGRNCEMAPMVHTRY